MKEVIFDNYDDSVLSIEYAEAGYLYVIIYRTYPYFLRKIQLEDRTSLWTWVALKHCYQEFAEADGEQEIPSHSFMECGFFDEILRKTHEKGYKIFQFDAFEDIVIEFSELEDIAIKEIQKRT